jgi:hypothetical protein
MQVSHELTVTARCPVNEGNDVYRLTVRTVRLVQVETILEAVIKLTDKPVFQENLMAALAEALGCEVETIGYHSGVKTTVVCWSDKP